MSLGWAQDNVSGIIQAFYPGAMGGRAIAEALFGEFSPSGKLPLTCYKNTADIPAFTDYNMANRTYRYYKGEPLYPFGYGLSYSTFRLSDVKADKTTVSVSVENTGAIPARETVQVYVSSPGTKEIRSLCGIGNLFLKAGEKTMLAIKLNKNAFSRYDENGNMRELQGKHSLSVGFTQPDTLSVHLYGQAPLTVELTV